MATRLTAPEWLQRDPVAMKEFERLKRNATLGPLDLGVLAAYCNAYSHYIQCVEEVRHDGDIIRTETAKGAMRLIPNPAIRMTDIYFNELTKAAKLLKLPDDETSKMKENRFAGLIK